ncbi:MAG: hypothetical protein ALAOOOJD_04699 [bacterium]|nr:hypothetical protein [bacterium]
MIHHAEAQRLLGGDHFTRHHQLRGFRGTDETRQEIRAAEIGMEADTNEREANTRRLRHHTNITSERNARAAARCRAIDRGNHRFVRRVNHFDHLTAGGD